MSPLPVSEQSSDDSPRGEKSPGVDSAAPVSTGSDVPVSQNSQDRRGTPREFGSATAEPSCEDGSTRSATPDGGRIGGGPLAGLDRWAEQGPWNPRFGPWFLYLGILALTLQARQWDAWAYPPLKVAQGIGVGYLVWRWRALVPELTLRYHRSVLPISLGLVVAWIFLNRGTVALFPSLAPEGPQFFALMRDANPTLFWCSAIAHLLAMATVVPLVEEIFNRSWLPRAVSDWRTAWKGILQALCDLPLIGDWLIRTEQGAAAWREPPAFCQQWKQHSLGTWSPFGVAASTAIFASVHAPCDWPGAILCGVTWCWLLHRTAHLGLGPIVWSHAIVNLLLWVYVVGWEAWELM